jgi:hypothetical protein
LKRDQLVELRQILTERFSESELQTLCFDLGVDYEGLPGAGKTDKARELVSYLARHHRVHELVQVGQQLRPDISWEIIGDVDRAPWSPDSMPVPSPAAQKRIPGLSILIIAGGGVILAVIFVWLIQVFRSPAASPTAMPSATFTEQVQGPADTQIPSAPSATDLPVLTDVPTSAPTGTLYPTVTQSQPEPLQTPIPPVQLTNLFVGMDNHLHVIVRGPHQPYRLYAWRESVSFGDEPHFRYYLIYETDLHPEDLLIVRDVNPDTIYCVEIRSADDSLSYDTISYNTSDGSAPRIGKVIGKYCPLDWRPY